MDETAPNGVAEAPQPTDIVERVAGGEGPITARAAAHSLIDARNKQNARERRNDDKDSEPTREGATLADESSPGVEPGNGAGPQAVPGETQGDDQAESSADSPPPIAPPRSWTKEDKELFKGLPRDTQERLVERERSREGDFLRRQNEAAEKLKGLSAREQAAEQAKRQYEAALPTLLQSLQQEAAEFSDIKSLSDIERVAREDWPRYVRWDAQQKKIAAVQSQVDAALARQSHETQHRWSSFAQQQDALLLEKAPELAEKGQMAKVAESAMGVLRDLGFDERELNDMWNGRGALSLRDHRVQLLIRDGVRYRDAHAAARSAAARPVPGVQRPGVAAPRGAEADARISALDSRLEQSGSLKDAAALLVAQRHARSRR
jgi:hypothetical protein